MRARGLLAWSIVLSLALPALARAEDRDALRRQALQVFYERCEIDPGSRAGERAGYDFDILLKLDYTVARIHAVARDISLDCEYSSFKTAILSTARLREQPGFVAPVVEPPEEEALADEPPEEAAPADEPPEEAVPTDEPPEEATPAADPPPLAVEDDLREISIRIYLDRCELRETDTRMRLGSVDWDNLLAFDFTPEQIHQLTLKLPQECKYISLKNAVFGMRYRLESGGTAIPESDDDDDDHFTRYQGDRRGDPMGPGDWPDKPAPAPTSSWREPLAKSARTTSWVQLPLILGEVALGTGLLIATASWDQYTNGLGSGHPDKFAFRSYVEELAAPAIGLTVGSMIGLAGWFGAHFDIQDAFLRTHRLSQIHKALIGGTIATTVLGIVFTGLWIQIGAALLNSGNWVAGHAVMTCAATLCWWWPAIQFGSSLARLEERFSSSKLRAAGPARPRVVSVSPLGLVVVW